MVRLKVSSYNLIACFEPISIPYGSIKRRSKVHTARTVEISIPYGSIKSCAPSEFRYLIKISIPYGSIKR